MPWAERTAAPLGQASNGCALRLMRLAIASARWYVQLLRDGKKAIIAARGRTMNRVLWTVCLGLLALPPLSAQELKLRDTLKGHTDWIESVASAPTGRPLRRRVETRRSRFGMRQPARMSPPSRAIPMLFLPSPSARRERRWRREVGTRQSNCGIWPLARTPLPTAVTAWGWIALRRPNGKIVASAAACESIKLWDLTTGKDTATLKGKLDGADFVVFSPDGKTLAAAGDDFIIELWDVANRKIATTFDTNSSTIIRSVAFSPNGKTVASRPIAGGMSNCGMWPVARTEPLTPI